MEFFILLSYFIVAVKTFIKAFSTTISYLHIYGQKINRINGDNDNLITSEKYSTLWKITPRHFHRLVTHVYLLLFPNM